MLSVATFPAFKILSVVEENAPTSIMEGQGEKKGGRRRVQREEGSITVWELLDLIVTEPCPILLSAIRVGEPIQSLS